ncbi:MAG: DUF4065 domain-containing protein, partial [Clostridia bacterium]|nr:DUF4065 domain-containing protein [Clostridia bacterium]
NLIYFLPKVKGICMTYPAIEVAKYIVTYCTEKKQPISNLKLQEILYFIWIDYYKLTGDKLYDDEIYAWPFGTVVPEVYYDYCCYAGLPISLKIDSQITEEDRLILSKIVDKYVTFSARKLVNMTREKIA